MEECCCSKVDFTNEIQNVEIQKLEEKINEIEEKIKTKAELILGKEDITHDEYQILKSYEYDLKNKIDNIKRRENKDEYTQILAKMFSKNF